MNRLEEKMGKNEQLSMEKFLIYLQKKDNQSAFREIESLVEEYPMDMRYQGILCEVYMQNDKKDEAYNLSLIHIFRIRFGYGARGYKERAGWILFRSAHILSNTCLLYTSPICGCFSVLRTDKRYLPGALHHKY